MKVRTLVALLLSIGAIAASSAAPANEPIQPIQAAAPKNNGTVDLGMMLFLIRACRSPASSPAIPVTT